MNATTLACLDPQRLHALRQCGGNGIESVHVSSTDSTHVRVVLLHPLPHKSIGAGNIRIEGGRRILGGDIAILQAHASTVEGFGGIDIVVDRIGDASAYTLRLVVGPNCGDPPPGIDARFAEAPFSFCSKSVVWEDCRPDPCPPTASGTPPPIDYLAKDYASFRRLMLDRLAQTIPEWTERQPSDLGVTLVETLAYAADHLSYYQDAVATEAYLATARRRLSVRRHARLVDYPMHDGCNARAWVYVKVKEDVTAVPVNGLTFYTHHDDPARQRHRHYIGGVESLKSSEESDRVVFEPMLAAHPAAENRQLYPSHNEIDFYTWGDSECCLLKGATSAALECPTPMLQPGDLLLFEETIGPRTGVEADADLHHRHVVRLTRVRMIDDRPPPTFQPVKVLDVSWDDADALPFSLCISTRGKANVSVARGNIVLVDHGLTNIDAGEELEALPSPTLAPLRPCPPCVPTLGANPPLAAPRRFFVVPFPRRKTRLPLTQADPFPNRIVQADTQARVLPRWWRDWVRFQEISRARSGTALTVSDEVIESRQGNQIDEWVRQTRAGRIVSEAERADFERMSKARSQPAIGEGGQTLALPFLIGAARSDLQADPRSATVKLSLTERDENGAESKWESRNDLLSSGPEDRHYVLEIDDEDLMWLRFGDGNHGLCPKPGTKFTITYRVGNGSAGNVGAGAINRVLGATSESIQEVRNPLPASGGADPEESATVKLLAPTAFRSKLRRAITADDYARLAESDPRVQRAAATLAWTGVGFQVRIVLDLFNSALASAPDPAAEANLIFEEIATVLGHYRRMGHDIHVGPARMVPIYLKLGICVEPHAEQGRVRTMVRAVLGTKTLPAGRRGFFHPDNLTFGTAIEASAIVAVVRAIPGVASVAIRDLRRWTPYPEPAGKQYRLTFGPLEIPRLDNDPAFPENGQLVLNLEGGR